MPQVKIGIVVSAKMPKTVVVKIVSRVKHPLYKKLIIRTRKFKVHDELGVKTQDKVKIIETRKISKDVHFKVLEVVG